LFEFLTVPNVVAGQLERRHVGQLLVGL